MDTVSMVPVKSKKISILKNDNCYCDFCDSDKIINKFKWHVGPYKIVQCENCGLIFTHPKIKKNDIKDFYLNKDSYSKSDTKSNTLTNWLVKKLIIIPDIKFLKNYLKPDAKVLDVGCGCGEYIHCLKNNTDWQVEGLEPAPFAAVRAKADYDVIVRTGTLENNNFEHEQYDLIIMKHVLEHLGSPKKAISEIEKLLKPGGFLFIVGPNVNTWEVKLCGRYWSPWEIPGHQYHFSSSSLTDILNSEDLSIISIKHALTPNNLIDSLANFLKAKNIPDFIVKFVSFKNPLLIIFFLPLSSTLGLFKKSGRISVIAQKK